MTFDFALPPLDAAEAPAFSNAAAAREWAQAQTISNPGRAQEALHKQIDLLNRTPLPAAERLEILDALKKLFTYVQDESAKRYVGKAVPLLFAEQAAFDAAHGLRRAFVTATLRCVADSLESDRLATALQRALAALAGEQFELLRARVQPDADLWRRLNGLIALAESRGLATRPVSDPLRYGEVPTSALAAYAEALLLHAASPFELPLRQLLWMARWARRWSGKLTLTATPPDDLGALPLAVDLLGAQPPRHLPYAGDGARLLLTGELRSSIKKRVAALADGCTPVELQLGDDCTQPACEQLLKTLYQRWCKGGTPRAAERTAADAPGRAAFGVATIHYHLSGGKRLQAPAQTSIADLRREREEMATFGTVQTQRREEDNEPAPPPIEDGWLIRDESATGLRLTRPLDGDGARIGHGLLVAVEPPGGKNFFLASVRWIMRDTERRLQAGVQLMPGPVLALAARIVGEPWHHAFLLPPLSARDEPASIVLPSGSFRIDRVIEVRGGGATRQIALRRLLERGADFERAAYESA
ncbi:MAG: hypothetical protein M0P39_06740 [Rhodocyclaceae bacterium]|nr:hypothetical protein [Rhodocyclaceae bacterium]